MYSFRPIYYLLRVCGMMPFTCIYDAYGYPHSPKIRKRDGLSVVIAICFYLSMTGLVIYHMDIKEHRHSPIYMLLLGNYVHLISCIIFGIVIIAIDLWNRFKLIDILKKFTIFDTKASL